MGFIGLACLVVLGAAWTVEYLPQPLDRCLCPQALNHGPFLRRTASSQRLPFFYSAFAMLNCPTIRSSSAIRALDVLLSLLLSLPSNMPGALSKNSLRHLYTTQPVTPLSRHLCPLPSSPPAL